MKMRKEYIINRLLQKIVFRDRKEGYVKIYPNNTKEHELTKFLVCDKLKRLGYKVYTECRFENNCGRADIVAISEEGKGYIIEILCSETQERLNEKLNKYPIEFELITVFTKNFDIDTWEL